MPQFVFGIFEKQKVHRIVVFKNSQIRSIICETSNPGNDVYNTMIDVCAYGNFVRHRLNHMLEA